MPPAAAPGLLAWGAAESGGRSVAVALSSPAAGGEGACAEITDVLWESLVLAEGSEGLKGSQKREEWPLLQSSASKRSNPGPDPLGWLFFSRDRATRGLTDKHCSNVVKLDGMYFLFSPLPLFPG